MAVTETYVDPAIAADSGLGTLLSPYGDLQFALDTMTRDATNGDRLNIKAGTDEILAAILSLTTYGTPTQAGSLVFQGYTAAADDGGIGGIDGNTFQIFDTTSLDFINWIDLDLHNVSGANEIIRVDDFCLFRNCIFRDGGSGILLRAGGGCVVESCYFTGGNNAAINILTEGVVYNCTIRNGASDFSIGIVLGQHSIVEANILILDGATDGVNSSGRDTSIRNNSIYSANGTGQGIIGGGADLTLLNNIIEGFSGVGGVGVAATGRIFAYGHNKFFNNTANEGTLNVVNDLGNNDTLTVSAFLDAAADDFRVTTAVKALAYPTTNFPNLSVRTFLDIGALQRLEGAVVIVPPVGVSLGRLYNVPAEDRIYEVVLP